MLYPQGHKGHILLKFISQPNDGDKLKYLHDFLNGNLYMNTLSYFWNEYMPKTGEDPIELASNQTIRPQKIPNQLPKGQGDILEGTVGIIPTENTRFAKAFKNHLLTDCICRANGFEYCNTLCFYRLDYQSFFAAKGKVISFDTSSAMNAFGQYVVVVKNEQELIRRISKKAEREKFKFVCGNVNYKQIKNGDVLKKTPHIIVRCGEEIDLDEIKSNIVSRRDCFDKEDIYKYQNEWRVALYRGEKSIEAYTLKVGNLRDICDWVHVQELEKYLERTFKSKVEPGTVGYYGNAQRNELRDLFYSLGNNKASVFGVIG